MTASCMSWTRCRMVASDPGPDLEAKRFRDASGGEVSLYRIIPNSHRFLSSKPPSVSPDSTANVELHLLSSVNKPFHATASDVRGDVRDMFLQKQPRCPWSSSTSNLPEMWRDGLSCRLLKDTASHWSPVSLLPAGEHLSQEVRSLLLAPKLSNQDLPIQASDVRDEVFKKDFLTRHKATIFSVLLVSSVCMGEHPCFKSPTTVAH